MKTSLPPLLAAFVAAHNAHDTDALIACFAKDAVVQDEHREHPGTMAIKAWFKDVSRKYRMALRVTRVTGQGNSLTLTGLVSGNFDGSPIRLRYRTTLKAGKITALKIAP